MNKRRSSRWERVAETSVSLRSFRATARCKASRMVERVRSFFRRAIFPESAGCLLEALDPIATDLLASPVQGMDDGRGDFAVPDAGDDRGERHDRRGEDFGAEKRVDQGGLSPLELPHDHEVEVLAFELVA